MLGSVWRRAQSYPLEQLEEEAAFIAYHFHWPMEAILDLEHADRRAWATQISRINERLNEESVGARA